jgi:hypothetical protein
VLSQTFKRIFSFPVMLAGLLVLLGSVTVRARLDDPDMWWHLKTGEVIWNTHSIPVADQFSYTTNHQVSIPQEWLSELTIYCAYKLSDLSGLMLWLVFFTAALVIAGYLLCSLYSGNAKVAFVGALIVWFFSTVGLAVRPQMIGYLFLIVELLVIHLGRRGNPRWFFWLPPLFALWINCHASFVLGIIVGGIYLFCSFFDFQAGLLISSRWDAHRQKTLALALATSAAALFLNPVGYKQILYPIDAMRHLTVNLGNVQEWRATSLADGRGAALMLVLLCSFLLMTVRKSEIHLDELLLMGAATWLGVSHVRTLFVFGILAAPILSRQLSTLWENYDLEKDRIWPNAVMIGLSLMGAILVFPGAQDLEAQVEAGSPVKAVEFLKANHLSGPMLNAYQDGGYLIWAAPEYPVFVDGRGDVFEWSGVLTEFGDWSTLQVNPNLLLEKYKINFCLLLRESPMVHVMQLLPGWKMVYSDDNSVIFERITSGG